MLGIGVYQWKCIKCLRKGRERGREERMWVCDCCVVEKAGVTDTFWGLLAGFNGVLYILWLLFIDSLRCVELKFLWFWSNAVTGGDGHGSYPFHFLPFCLSIPWLFQKKSIHIQAQPYLLRLLPSLSAPTAEPLIASHNPSRQTLFPPSQPPHRRTTTRRRGSSASPKPRRVSSLFFSLWMCAPPSTTSITITSSIPSQ